MRDVTRAVGLAAAAILWLAGSQAAHHGTTISYDRSKPLTLKGMITNFQYVNPHEDLLGLASPAPPRASAPAK
jgi:hypothetical protein